MADKLQSYMELAKQTTSRITQNLNQWKSFLNIVARFYKYEYYEQLLIYAQRPDAIACADYATWKNRMRRWVKRGAKGIALIDYKGDHPQLRYVFDISDTDGNENSRPVWQWGITKENQNAIIEVMGQYSDRPLNSLTDALIKCAEQLAIEYYTAHKDDIQIALEFSNLKRYNKDEQEMRFCQLAQSSIAYVLLYRCGYNADKYINIEQFETINEFSDFLAVSALGVCTRYSAEQVLRQIERAAINVIRERRNNHERTELHPAGGLSISRPENDGTAEPNIGQIRADAPRLSEAASRNSVRDNENSRDVIPSPIGSRSYRESESRTNNQGNGEVGERERGVESQRPNDMGGSDEQSQKRSRGNRPARTDLQLSEKRETADNLSAVFSVSSKHVGRTLLEPTHRASESSGQISLFQLSPHELSSSVQLSLFGNADNVKTIRDLTPDINSNFELRRQVLQHLTEYQNGTFSLLGEDISPFPSNYLDKSAEPSSNSYHVVESDDGNAADNVILEVSDSSDKNDSERVDKFPQQENEVEESNETLPSPETTPVKPHKNVAFSVFKPEIPAEQRHNYRISDMRLGDGTASERYSANIAAIRCLKQIEAEERLATPEEQEILSRYVGWGGLSDCFDERHSKYQELKSLLDEDEYSAARTSALTAFYTSPTIIKAMYQALARMGFRSGNILEPSCATGNFIGGLPDSMMDSKIYGVEIDDISGRIARQLYPESRIEIAGFEDVELPDSFFDVAIGNVPFGNLKVFDRRYNKYNFLIHDYFFAKAIDKVRPGGVIAFITSNGMGGGTFDKQTDKARKYLAQRCELVGAIRLPSNAFTENAGTDITTDILFLQKLDKQRGMDADVPEWVNTSVYHESDYVDKDGAAHHQIITLNDYYLKHPEMVLGKHEVISGPFGPQLVCSPVDRPLSELLQKAIQNISAEIKPYEVSLPDNEDEAISADPNVRNYSYTVVDGNLYFRENSLMYPVHVSKTAENRIRGMIRLRDCTRRLIEYQTENYPDETIQAEQSELNRLYDDYVKHYGYISNQGNRLAFRDDSSYFLLCSLEIFDDEGNFKHKSDMFTKRTIRTHIPVTSVETASEALAVSISEKAKIDLEYMSELSKKTPDELEAELKGVIFRDVYCAEEVDNIPKAFVDLARFPLVTADEYLSGNVRRKLRMARALKEARPDLEIEENIKALEAVQPEDLTASEISVHIGATWIPPEIYRQFMFELLDTSKSTQDKIQVLYSKSSGEWNITNKSADSQNLKIRTTYGTMRMNAYHILESTLNLRTVRIFDIEVENGKERRVYNRKQSAAAQDRQELIKSKFVDWIWKDIDRRERLCKLYNEQFNAIRPREYDGSHIKFVGMNPEITLRKHQLNAIAHILYGNNTLLAHAVGAGKTYEMVAAAMESKRLGLCTKSLIVVPNHITGQWASEWLQLYPSANILVADEKDFQTDNRKKFCARIATGDYDAVIIGHSQFEKIPISVERQKALLNQQIDEIMNGISNAEAADAERFTVKQLERRKKNLEVKLKKLNDQSRKDNVVAFEELGIDRIFVDESHYYKNLFLVTKMHNAGGISQTDAQKSSDLFAKCRYLSEMTGGKGIVFATGTPISNSMTELYTIQRYLQYNTLEEAGLLHFDEWASIFGETVTKGELAPEGTGFRLKTRFARFHNLPELMSIFKECADIQTADMLNLPVPKANFHTEVVKPSELQKQTVKSLAERAEAIRNGRVEPWKDNMLKITNDGRKLALDMRLLNPLLPEDENGKIAVCAGNVYQIWDKTRDKKSTQLVFCDLSTPKNDGSYDVYNNLKQQLMNRGVPEEEIAFIHDAHTKVQKQALFTKVRSGQIRILMGSTQKMGAGTNVQDQLIALHDLDCPWRPSDLEQRMGRIVRQGNENSEVEIYRYVTEGTFDSYLYQLIENKQHFISQIMTSKSPARVAEDIDQASLNYAEIKALASGNPMIIEKCNLEIDVNKLQMLKSSYLNQKYELENLLVRTYPQRLKELEEQISGRERDVKLAKENPKIPEGFPTMLIKGVSYSDKKDAGKALLTVCKEITDEQFHDIGQYRGFKMSMRYDSFYKDYYLSLKGELSYTVNIEGDVYGNITRIDNAIDGIGKAISVFQEERKSIEKQIDNAQEELNKPFIHDAELEEKLARLRVVNHTLSLDKIEQEADFNDFIAPLEQDNGQEALKEEMEFC